jgi:hypothetical protein
MLQDKMMEKAASTGNDELEKCTEEWHNKCMENEFAIFEYVDVLMKKMPVSMRARAVKEIILMRNLAMRSGRDVLRMFIDEMEKERDTETTSDSNKENEYPNTDSDTSGPVLGSDTDPDSDNSEDSDNPDDIIGYPSRGVLLLHPNQMEHFDLVELDEESNSSYMSNNYKHLWLVDSGASSHLTNNLEGMFNIRNLESRITVGEGRWKKHDIT